MLGSEWDARLPLRVIRLGVGVLFAFGATAVALAARG
jgi:hypothetical protein